MDVPPSSETLSPRRRVRRAEPQGTLERRLGEHQHEQRDGLDPSERQQVISAALAGPPPPVRGGSAHPALQPGRGGHGGAAEHADRDRRRPRPAGERLAGRADHHVHQDHAVDRLRQRRPDEGDQDERDGLVLRVAALPRADHRQSGATGSDRGADRGQAHHRGRSDLGERERQFGIHQGSPSPLVRPAAVGPACANGRYGCPVHGTPMCPANSSMFSRTPCTSTPIAASSTFRVCPKNRTSALSTPPTTFPTGPLRPMSPARSLNAAATANVAAPTANSRTYETTSTKLFTSVSGNSACWNQSRRSNRHGVENITTSVSPTANAIQPACGNGSPSTSCLARKYIVQVVATQPTSASARTLFRYRSAFQTCATVRCTAPIAKLSPITFRSEASQSRRPHASSEGSAAMPNRLPLRSPHTIVPTDSRRNSAIRRGGVRLTRANVSVSARNTRP